MALSKFPLGGWIFGGQRKKNETPPPIPRIATELEVRELRYLFTSNFCTVSAKSVDHNSWPLEHFPEQ